MEYLFILCFQLIGFWFWLTKKLKRLDDKYPELSLKDIKKLFYENEMISMFASVGVLVFHLMGHLMMDYYWPSLEKQNFEITIQAVTLRVPYLVLEVAFAFVLGWQGQRLIYAALGKAEKKIEEKIKNF